MLRHFLNYILSTITAQHVWTFQIFLEKSKFSKNLKKHQFEIAYLCQISIHFWLYICAIFHSDCIVLQISILAVYLCKLSFWLHISAIFYSGWIFVQNFLSSWMFVQILLSHIFLCNVSFKLYNYANVSWP